MRYRLGVPYHSWRITHGQHHASTAHMTKDQVFVPSTRSQLGLKPLDPEQENLLGSRVTEEISKELWDALGDSPIGALVGSATYLACIVIAQVYNVVTYICCPTARWMACLP